eukprot:jgi/Chlat1/3652/Chrsp238S03649
MESTLTRPCTCALLDIHKIQGSSSIGPPGRRHQQSSHSKSLTRIKHGAKRTSTICQAAGDGDKPGVDVSDRPSFNAFLEGIGKDRPESGPESESTAQALLERAQSVLRDANDLLQKPLGSPIGEDGKIERYEEEKDMTRSVLRQLLRAERAGASTVDNDKSAGKRRQSNGTGTTGSPAGASVVDNAQSNGTRREAQNTGSMRPPTGPSGVDNDQSTETKGQSTGRTRPPAGPTGDKDQFTGTRTQSTVTGGTRPPAGGSIGDQSSGTRRQSQINGSMRPASAGTEVVQNNQTIAAQRQAPAGASVDDYDQLTGTSRQSTGTGTRRPSPTQRKGGSMDANLRWGAEHARFSSSVFNQDPTPWSPTPQLQRAEAKGKSSTIYAEPERPTTLQSVLQRSALPPLQSEVERMAVLSADLPPLQSVMEMTTAYRPPVQSEGAEQVAEVRTAHGDHWGEDLGLGEASGIAEDGTQWWRASGEDFGENGLRVKWTLLRGVTAAGIEWEETWWEKSDWLGYRELGARKSGADENGGSWTETWKEALTQDSDTGLTRIEKSAHKWAQTGQGEEWEEKWWEAYDARGWTSKTADKWSKNPGHVHHERWGEEWDGKGAATKWTDRWAEEIDPYTGKREWGDKWEEKYGWGGEGRKSGENWSKEEGSEQYSRTWGENHFGNGMIQKYGHSTTGDYWDTTEPGDTWFERKPHYGFKEAYRNSWNLRQLKARKRRPF